MADIYIFRRVEKKYCISVAQKDRLLSEIGAFLLPDRYGKSTVCSLYLDTPDRRIIRNSIEAKGLDKPAYKEKLRLRSYGTPTAESRVFLEIKKKFKGVVYKRRVVMSLAEANRYLTGGEKPFESQIMSEIDYAIHFYRNPGPAMITACEREAYTVKDIPNLRLTFDRSVRARDTDLDLAHGAKGTLLLPEDQILLEVKTDGAMPLWLSHALDRNRLFPTSFSKYGTAYLRSLQK